MIPGFPLSHDGVTNEQITGPPPVVFNVHTSFGASVARAMSAVQHATVGVTISASGGIATGQAATANTQITISAVSQIQSAQLHTIACAAAMKAAANTGVSFSALAFSYSVTLRHSIATAEQFGANLSILLARNAATIQGAGQSAVVALAIQSAQTRAATNTATAATSQSVKATLVAVANQTHNVPITIDIDAALLPVEFLPIPGDTLRVYIASDNSLAAIFAAADAVTVAAQSPDGLDVATN